MSTKKFEELFKTYNCDTLRDEDVKKEVEDLLNSHFEENNNIEVYKQCFHSIDLTTLQETDTERSVGEMVQKVNDFEKHFPEIPLVGAICVYPSMVPAVKDTLTEDIGIASVAAAFPSSQTFIEIKVAEVAMCVMEGASEIDVVISVGDFLEGKYEQIFEELTEIKSACRGAKLKIILETGSLQNVANIKRASILAMQAGADFIKTSTGKVAVSATPESTFVMCSAIKEWHEKTGIKVGYKPAGGVRTAEDAVKHYTLVKEILGEEWLTNEWFRIGASSLANSLLTAIEGKEISYF